MVVLNIQETHLENSGDIPFEWLHYENKYTIVSSDATNDDRFGGIIFFINKNLEIIESESIIPGRVLHIKTKNTTTSELINYVSIYGKASGNSIERQEIFCKVLQHFSQTDITEDYIFLGDFNFVESNLDRNTNNINQTDKTCFDIWSKVEMHFGVVDCFRNLNKNRRLYSYSSPNNSKSRIDRIYVPLTKIGNVLNTKFENVEVSDHKIVRISFKQTVIHGPGNYIFNNSLLNDPIFVSEIRDIFADFNDSERMFNDNRTLYDFLKMAICEHSKVYSKKKALQRRNEYLEACKKIEMIESMHKDALDTNLITELENLKKIEIKFLNYKRAGAFLRAKIPNFEENELQIAFISRIEKLRGEDNAITELIDNEGNLKSGTENVLNVVHSFYSDLYKWEQEDIFLQNSFFRNINVRLTQTEGHDLGLPLDKDFLFEALCDLPNNKSPGEDSLTKEFFVFFWNEIFPFYAKCIYESKAQKELCESQKRGLIKLAYKKNERFLLKNFRPISLLNVDLKIITRALAKRLSKVIGNIISNNQTCLPGRQIFVNLHILQDIIDYINGKNEKAAILFFDAAKAFDRMSHSFLFKTLRHFGCGEDFIEWIRIIYGHCTSRIKVNGFTTAPVLIKRGIRQGCPLSSLLYVMCAEVLSLEIKRNENIVGFKYNNQEYKNSGYADDLSAIVTEKESINELFNTLDNFGKATNAKINVEKTEAIWIGSWKNNLDRPKNLKWTNTMINNLGIWIGNNRKDTSIYGFREIREKIKNKIKFWSGKGITLKGRVRVVNTFIYRKLWYASEIHSVSSDIKLEIQRLITNYIWGGNFRERSLQGLEAHYSNGGLQLINIDKRVSALRVKWLSRILESDQNSIEFFLADSLISSNNLSIGISILKGYTSFYIRSIKNSFYKEACLAWARLNLCFSPCNAISINDLWIYGNILLKDDDGRVYKPPGNTRINRISLPFYFRDLPFPIINRRPDEARTIRSINRAFHRIQWNNDKNVFYMRNGDTLKNINKSTFKEIYWNFFEQETLPTPWKSKWENILNSSHIDWILVWKNVHDNLLNYNIQSMLWRMTNLGFISSNRLNRIFGSANICRQCNEEEEGFAHCFLYCNVSNLVYTHFQNLITHIINRVITLEEKAFGILIEDFKNDRISRLVNYILGFIKYIIFIRRARTNTLNETTRANLLIREIKKTIALDLQSKFCLAKHKKTLQNFKENFLYQEVLAKIQNNELIISNSII